MAAIVLASISTSGRCRAQVPTAIPSGTVTSGALSFDGHSTLGDFTGTTTTVRGAVRGAASIDSVSGWVEAPVNTLRTGNGKRDRDMMSSMEADRFPGIRYELSSVTRRGTRGDTLDLTLHGNFVIHGVTRPVDLQATAVFAPGQVRIQSSVPLDLNDYHIEGLSKMLGILKMHPGILVHVDVTFGLAAPVPPRPGA
ncbi:MAG TPA: YceI family protein [Gemmatimonadales bacterium]|nr:YceI family protein [Gemmatimonadales bacterium]